MTDKDYVCEDYGDQKDWVQVRVSAPLTQLEVLSSVMSMINENLMIEDYSDIDLKTCYGDLIDESILNADKTVAAVSVFLPADVGISDALAFLRERMEADGIDGKVTLQGVNEEDWANNWKQYYKPIHIGQKLVIVPAWESYTPAAGEITVRMDPGMAFGTGTHETTRLVITRTPATICWTWEREAAFLPSALPNWARRAAVLTISTRWQSVSRGKTLRRTALPT